MKPPAFQFYPSDFMMGTCMMTAEEVGAYIRLLCIQWDVGFLPNDDATLCRLGGCGGIAVASLRLKFEVGSDGKLRNSRLEQERSKQREYREKQAANGAKRWAGNAKPHAVAIPTHDPDSMPNGCSPSTSSSTSSSTSLTSDSACGGGAARREDSFIPESLRTPTFLAAWASWKAHWEISYNHGAAMTPQTTDMHLRSCAKWGPTLAVQALETSMSRKFREPGLPFTGPAGSTPPAPRPDIYTEPAGWREKAKRLWPDFDVTPAWAELSSTVRNALISP